MNSKLADGTLIVRLHTHSFNGPLSGTTRVSWYQNGKPVWILMKQETVSGSGINWAICKSAPRSRQITTPAPHRSSFYRPGAIPCAQPTESKHWRQYYSQITATKFATLFQQNCHLSKPSSKDHTISAQVHSYVNNSDMSDLFDVETVSQCLSQMKKR